MRWSSKALRLGVGILSLPLIVLMRGLFGVLRLIGPDRSAEFGGWLARSFGPLLTNHKTAIANLRASFPEMDDADISRIARAAWDNLGRTGAEYPHLKHLVDFDPDNPVMTGRLEVSGIEHFLALRDDDRPGIIFAAHLANWELPAVVAARYGLNVTAVFRAPNNAFARRLVAEMRSETMGGLEATGRGSAFKFRRILEEGGHLGALVDQRFRKGVSVPFFGRPALTNPLLAKLARQFDCPVHGVRVIRLPENRLRIELTPPIAFPRDESGMIDESRAIEIMTATVEGWVREYPEQWLWMHRRWRAKPSSRRVPT